MNTKIVTKITFNVCVCVTNRNYFEKAGMNKYALVVSIKFFKLKKNGHTVKKLPQLKLKCELDLTQTWST